MDFILQTMIFVRTKSPEDLICEWRTEAGIFRLMGMRGLKRDHGREESKKIWDELSRPTNSDPLSSH